MYGCLSLVCIHFKCQCQIPLFHQVDRTQSTVNKHHQREHLFALFCSIFRFCVVSGKGFFDENIVAPSMRFNQAQNNAGTGNRNGKTRNALLWKHAKLCQPYLRVLFPTPRVCWNSYTATFWFALINVASQVTVTEMTARFHRKSDPMKWQFSSKLLYIWRVKVAFCIKGSEARNFSLPLCLLL